MSRPESKKPLSKKIQPTKRNTSGAERFSVSETKARLSEVLRLARDGRSVIVTDHGLDVVRVEAITPQEKLSLISPNNSFAEVRNARAPEREKQPVRSALEILQEDRRRR